MIKFYLHDGSVKLYIRRWAVTNNNVARMVSIVVKEQGLETGTADLVMFYAGVSILNPEDTYSEERELQICEGRVRKLSEYQGVHVGWYEGRNPIAVIQKELRSQRILEEVFQKTLTLVIKNELSKYHKVKGVEVEEIIGSYSAIIDARLQSNTKVEAEHTS